jgi:hypothetical protein
MRHYLQLAFAIPLLPTGVSSTAIAGGLVPTTSLAKAPNPCRLRASRAAVAMPSIAVAAEEEDLTARRVLADDEPQRFQAPSAGRVEVDDHRRA